MADPQDKPTCLLPCPFCGDSAHTTDHDGMWYVTCNGDDCYCVVGEGYDRDAMPQHAFNSETDAVTAWNRRAP